MGKFDFKKKFGQNFIKNKKIVEDIVNRSEIPEDTLVIEVGPGMGILTEEICKKAKQVVSYEVDKELKPFLDEKFRYNEHVEIIYDDFLSRDIEKDIYNYPYKQLYFIANVPYYITTPILMKIMECHLKVEKIVMMVQKEVGERFSACCGSKNYSSISVYLNYFFDIEKLFIVQRDEFVPVPNVDSIVIAFTRKKELLMVKSYDFFFKLVKDSFQFKRKTIKNNLKNYDLDRISLILSQNQLSLNSRGEDIPVRVFVKLSNELSI